jgi:hypothetical protein
MRPVIEGLIACCSAAQTNRSNGRVLGLEGCTISDWHKGYRCRCLLLLPFWRSPGYIYVQYLGWAGWTTGTIRRTQTEASTVWMTTGGSTQVKLSGETVEI